MLPGQKTDILIQSYPLIRPAETGKRLFHPDYLKAVESAPSSRAWFEALTETLPAALRKVGWNNAFPLLINSFIQFIPLFTPTDFISARLDFSADPQLSRLIGGDLPVAVVTFEDPQQFEGLQVRLGREVTAESISVRMPFGYLLSRLGIPSDDEYPVSDDRF